MAPGVTFWDAGEFIAAVHAFGIPHPPGTPLFVALGRLWTLLLGGTLGFARSMNLLSAVSTAAACGLGGWAVARETGTERGRAWGALAGALCAGLTTSVWANATETEVYAISLLHVMLMLACAMQASNETGASSNRWLLGTAYIVALAPAVHLSALVGAPAAIALASRDRDGGWHRDRVLLLGGILVATAGVGRMSWLLFVAGAGLSAMSIVAGRRPGHDAGRAIAPFLASMALGMLAWSALLVMLVRARHDPAVNQGNPATLAALVDVVARHQYAVAPLWPRQAPEWLQLATLGQYVDWQFAMAWGEGIFTTPARLSATIAFLFLGAAGWHAMRHDARRICDSLAILTVCGSLGVCTYLNLKSGASIGYGFVPAGAHEARERDYFFVLGFWGWGMFAGYGAFSLVRRLQWAAWMAVGAAIVPLLGNWTANDRAHGAEATAARDIAAALLSDTPQGAVLFLSGDNDSYPLWYLQEVERVRPDVTPVTLPLLSATWYDNEIARRTGLRWQTGASVNGAKWRHEAEAALISGAARTAGRAVAVSAELGARERSLLGSSWVLRGTVYLSSAPPDGSIGIPVIDSLSRTHGHRTAAVVRDGTTALPDDVSEMMLSLLDCSRLGSPVHGHSAARDSLEVTCNLR